MRIVLQTKTIAKLHHSITRIECCAFIAKMSSKIKKRKASGDQPEASASKVKVKEEPLSDDEFAEIRHSRTNVSESVQQFNFNKKRVRILSDCKDIKENCKAVVYWMSRDGRVQDNWSMLYAQKLSMKFNVPFHVCFCLVPTFLNATRRQYNFLLGGLQEVEKECHSLNIPFHLLFGEAPVVLSEFVKTHDCGVVITDFSPLRIMKKWLKDLMDKLPRDVPVCQVDAHNIVPCWIASDKLEFAARTIRKKIHDKLPEFLTYFPPVVHSSLKSKLGKNDWKMAVEHIKAADSTDVAWAVPGTEAGLRTLQSFCQDRLKGFASFRNSPNYDNLSNLSPWFHFGQVSVQRAILEVKKYRSKYKESVDAFIEEAIIRRELADNYCYYSDNYDNLNGAWKWARDTLKTHESDKRPYVFTKQQFENAETKDPLWNAAQRQLVKEAKMHGFLRMYWAKKILEWTKTPEEALEIAIYLNDKYNLDGRDPNGYVGCMWSICGVHDRPWRERAIFGKIRYMNYEGCKRKFDVDAFVRKYKSI